MLKLLRDKRLQKKIYIFLAIVVIASFGLSGVMIGNDGAGRAGDLAKYEKTRFGIQDYLNSYRAVQRQASFVYGDQLAAMQDRINYKGEAWDRLLLLEQAKKQGLKAADKEVIAWITKQEGFKKDGKFDDAFYRLYVERAYRTTPRQFEEEIRQMMTISLLQEDLKKKLDLTDEKLKELYIEENTAKDIVYALLPWESVQSEVTVKDSDIEQLFEVLKDKMNAPEKAKLEYVFIPKEEVEAKKDALADTQSSFQDLAAKYGLSVSSTGLFSRNDAVAELSEVPAALAFAFDGAVGDVSDWFRAPKGEYRVRIADRQAEHPMSLEEAREELIKEFKKQEAAKLVVTRLQEIKAKVVKPEDFETVMKEAKAEVVPLEKYKKGMYPAGIWPSENLQKTVASMKENEISDAFEVPKGAMVVKVVKIAAADISKFEEEKSKFRERTESQKVQEELMKLLETLREKLSINLELMKEIFPADAE